MIPKERLCAWDSLDLGSLELDPTTHHLLDKVLSLAPTLKHKSRAIYAKAEWVYEINRPSVSGQTFLPILS